MGHRGVEQVGERGVLVGEPGLIRGQGEGRPMALLGRRLDDLAYGAGLWLGAARSRSLQCLTPRLVRRPRR